MEKTIQLFAATPKDIEGDIKSFSIQVVLTATLILVVLMIIAAITVNNKKLHALKKPLFILIVATIALPTLLMAGSSVYINTVADSKGPVHWHADIEYWVCGNEVNFRDPTGFLSNKTGSSTFHEHNDKRIHLEGVVVEKEYDASLEKFMNVAGGSITPTSINIPTSDIFIEDDIDGDVPSGNPETVREFIKRDDANMSVIALNDGQECEPGVPAELQVFMIRFNKENDTYTQTKLTDPGSYTLRDESIVPPGDCVIVEFDKPKTITDRLCREYGVRDVERCVDFGVSTFNPDLCKIRFELTDDQKRELENQNTTPLPEIQEINESEASSPEESETFGAQTGEEL